MEEHQVTADGDTFNLPEPFFVIATQNPIHQVGTFPLPESQLDRFLMCIGLGYPARPLERQLLRGDDQRRLLQGLDAVITADEIRELQGTARSVHVSEPLLDYVQSLVAFTREAPHFEFGLSPRGAVDLMNASRCWAMISGHTGVRPEDVKTVFPAVVTHRLRVRDDTGTADGDFVAQVLESVPIP